MTSDQMNIQFHELKTINPYFNEMWNGNKKFELRKNDRGFHKGDILWLRECSVFVGHPEYSGKSIVASVTYVLENVSKYGLMDGYCIMGIEILEHIRTESY